VRQKEGVPENDVNIHEQFTRYWTSAQPAVASYLGALLPDFRDAEDLLQNVAVACLRKFADYDPQRPFTAWALGIARLEALSRRRTQARCRLLLRDDLLDQLSAVAEEIAPELERRSVALRECLKHVPNRATELLRLRYDSDLKPAVSYALEGSSDFQTWFPLQTNTATGLTLEFEDAAAANISGRFYRARLVNP